MIHTKPFFAFIAGALLLLAACDQNMAPPGAQPKASSAPVSAPAEQPAAQPTSGGGASIAGITWTPPANWPAQGQRPMRAATYAVPAARGGEAGECAVFYFGQGQGGDVDANLKRWVGQFEQPGGGSSEQAAKIDHRTINGLKVTTVEVTGTYMMSMGGPMSSTKEPKPGYRLLGAIIEAPGGNVFFKFTGPAVVVGANESAFRAMLDSIRTS